MLLCIWKQRWKKDIAKAKQFLSVVSLLQCYEKCLIRARLSRKYSPWKYKPNSEIKPLIAVQRKRCWSSYMIYNDIYHTRLWGGTLRVLTDPLLDKVCCPDASASASPGARWHKHKHKTYANKTITQAHQGNTAHQIDKHNTYTSTQHMYKTNA